jgi:hypothetical protein
MVPAFGGSGLRLVLPVMVIPALLQAGCGDDRRADVNSAIVERNRGPGAPTLVRSPDAGPEYPNARLSFAAPEAGARVPEGEAVEVRFSVTGFDLTAPTPGGEERGIARSTRGQHLHLVVNDRPYEAIYDLDEPFELEDLPAGTHVLRAFPGRDWHEAVKTPGALAQRLVVVGEDEPALPALEEWGPTVIYSRPQGLYEGQEADSVLVDFYLSNVRLSSDGHRVRLTLNGEQVFEVTEWAPYLLLGLPEGEHTLRLELLDPHGVPVHAPFHPVERSFEVRER